MATPDKTIFNDQLAAADAVVRSAGLAAGLGTSLYEWISRPLAYIFSALYTEFNDYIGAFTIQALAQSLQTVNPTADAVMSNYFVTRRGGVAASADVVIYSTSASTTVPAGTVFQVSGVSMAAEKTFIIAPGNDDIEDTSSAMYLAPTAVSGGTYLAVIQVVATAPVAATVPAGSEVLCTGYIQDIVRYELGSDLIGGSAVETDAEMVSRAKSALASSVGGRYTYLKKLENSGYPVKGCFAAGFTDPEMIRDSYSGLLMGLGGCVDLWVKSESHTQTATVQVYLTRQGSGVYTGYVPSAYAGLLSVSAVTISTGTLTSFISSFGSSDATLPEQAVRGSVKQTTMITAMITDTAEETVVATVQVVYMPHIYSMQDYMNEDANALVGVSTLVRASRPIYLGLSGALVGVDASACIAAFKIFLDSLGVGAGPFRVSEFTSFLQKTYPAAVIHSPVMIHAGYYTPDGVYRTEHTADGVWQPREFKPYGFTTRVHCYMTRDDLNHFN